MSALWIVMLNYKKGVWPIYIILNIDPDQTHNQLITIDLCPDEYNSILTADPGSPSSSPHPMGIHFKWF